MKTTTLDAEHTAAEFMACVQFAQCNSCLLHIVCQFLISLFIALHERLWPKSARCTAAQPNSAGFLYKICSLDMPALAFSKSACLDPCTGRLRNLHKAMLRLCRGTCQTKELTRSGYTGSYSRHIHDWSSMRQQTAIIMVLCP